MHHNSSPDSSLSLKLLPLLVRYTWKVRSVLIHAHLGHSAKTNKLSSNHIKCQLTPSVKCQQFKTRQSSCARKKTKTWNLTWQLPSFFQTYDSLQGAAWNTSQSMNWLLTFYMSVCMYVWMDGWTYVHVCTTWIDVRLLCRGHGSCFPSHANEAMGFSRMGMWTHIPVPALHIYIYITSLLLYIVIDSCDYFIFIYIYICFILSFWLVFFACRIHSTSPIRNAIPSKFVTHVGSSRWFEPFGEYLSR